MKIVLIGPPGSGKGTQAEMISSYYKLIHISMGELLREIAKDNTEISRNVKKIMEEGTLVPDELTNSILKDRLKKMDCKKGFILDGYPRTMKQIELMEKGVDVDHVIYLEITEDVVVKRLSSRWQCKNCSAIYGLDIKPKKIGICDKCGSKLVQRDDDKEETVRSRMKTFNKLTKPLIDHYKSEGLLRKIDGNQKPERIFEAIKKILD